MNDMQAAPRATVGARPPAWIELVGALLRPWLRIRREPADAARFVPDDDVPTVYIVERYGLSDTLILEQACRDAGLPSPYAIAGKLPIKRRSAVVSLSRRPRLFGRRPHPSRSETLTKLAEALNADPSTDVRLVPVSIFVGRAPDRESGWFSVLFSENWVVVGRFRRLLALLLNGRDTIVQFAQPVSMREAMAAEEPERGVRKLQRLLRVHFRRIRAVVIGPDLSHRRTVVDALLNTDPVRNAIDAVASKENIPRDAARERARKYAMEIAADYSHPVVRSLQFMLKGFWNKLYDGVDVHHFDTIRKVAPGHEIIYVPCHRSHVDYLLLSYQLLTNHVAIPHIGAGINLNMPVIGPILRRGSAFFLRRTFKGDPLYSTVFREYISQLFARGVSLEYFIEGGRSRTGRLLSPRGGMLSMTLRSFLRESRRPVVFQPVYIGYEKIMEGDAYIGELSGKAKEKESLLGFFKAFGALRQHYGRVALNFGEPIFLRPLLDDVAPGWEAATADPEAKPEWLNRAVDTLAERILENVNRAAHVNPINLLALSLLSTPKHAMTEADLAAQIDLFKALLIELPYSDRVTMTELSAAQIIAYGEKMGWIRRTAHPLGDVLGVDDKEGVLLSYFRNNVTHLYATAGWVACCFLNNRRMARASILRLGRLVYPFIQSELFLPWSDEEFATRIQQTIDFFIARGLLGTDAEGRVITREAGQSDSAFRLRAVARNLLPAIERYYIGLALLVKNGPHTLSAGELETLCWLTAQRLSLLHELNAPEFFDRSLFRGFIQKLRERRVISGDENGKLVFDAELNAVAQDARVILSREIRHSILKLTPEKQAELTRNADGGSTQA
jgi:glycerol-3-phosphate O-acyltransferase